MFFFTKTQYLIVFPCNFFLQILAHSNHHTFSHTLSNSEHRSNKNIHSIPFLVNPFEPYIFFSNSIPFGHSAPNPQTPSFHWNLFSSSCTFFPFLPSMCARTLVHRAKSSNENLLYIKHYALSSRIPIIVNSSSGLKT